MNAAFRMLNSQVEFSSSRGQPPSLIQNLCLVLAWQPSISAEIVATAIWADCFSIIAWRLSFSVLQFHSWSEILISSLLFVESSRYLHPEKSMGELKGDWDYLPHISYLLSFVRIPESGHPPSHGEWESRCEGAFGG